MIIDGHSHACGKFLTAESIVKVLDDNGVDKVVLVPGELNSKSEYSLPDIASKFPNKNVVKVTNYMTKLVMTLTGKVKDIPAGNEHVYDLKDKTDNRVIQFIWATTKIKNITDYLDSKFNDWAFHGVKLHQCWEKYSVDSVFFRQVASWTEKNDLPLFIHLFSDKEVVRLIDYKREHPKLKLIVAHLFGLEIFISKNFKDDNLYFDSSTIQLISDHRLKMAIDFVGANRILFGTDTPYGAKDNISRNLTRLKELDIPNRDKELILGENMKRLLNI